MIRGVNFAYMDVSQNNYQLSNMSIGTKTPIQYVPHLLLFAHGRVIAQFFQDEDNPKNNIPKMQHFIAENIQRYQQSQSTRIAGSSNGSSLQEEGNNIPPYTIGIPGNLASRKVCKLYNNAYVKQ